MTTRASQPSLETPRSEPRFLRLVLKLDAVATGAVGLLAAAAGARLDKLFGLPFTLLLSAGVFLVVYAALVWLTGARRRVSHAAVQLIVVVNLLYVLGCLALLAFRPLPLTSWGIVFALVQAAAVSLFAALQVVGLRRSRRT